MKAEQIEVLREMVQAHESQVKRLERAIRNGARHPEALTKLINRSQMEHAALTAALRVLETHTWKEIT